MPSSFRLSFLVFTLVLVCWLVGSKRGGCGPNLLCVCVVGWAVVEVDTSVGWCGLAWCGVWRICCVFLERLRCFRRVLVLGWVVEVSQRRGC